MQKVVLATGNAGKVRELASLLSDFGLDIVAQTDLGVDSAEETGNCRRLRSGGRCTWRCTGDLLRALFR